MDKAAEHFGHLDVLVGPQDEPRVGLTLVRELRDLGQRLPGLRDVGQQLRSWHLATDGGGG